MGEIDYFCTNCRRVHSDCDHADLADTDEYGEEVLTCPDCGGRVILAEIGLDLDAMDIDNGIVGLTATPLDDDNP